MPFEAKLSRIRVAGTLAILLAFFVCGLWLVGAFGTPPGAGIKAKVAGGLLVLFFGAAIPFTARRLFQAGVVMRIDATGIWFRPWSDEVIPWSAISRVAVHYSRVRLDRAPIPIHVLYLRDPAAYPYRAANPLQRRVQRYSRERDFGDITLSISDTDRSFDDLTDAINFFAPAELRQTRSPDGFYPP